MLGMEEREAARQSRHNLDRSTCGRRLTRPEPLKADSGAGDDIEILLGRRLFRPAQEGGPQGRSR